MHEYCLSPTAPSQPKIGSKRGDPGLRHLAVVAALGLALASPLPAQAKSFRCGAGDVPCLIAAIHAANANGQPRNTIRLEAGTYTLTAVENMTSVANANGLPVITSPLTILRASAEATIIERDASAPDFRLLSIGTLGTLTLKGLTLRGGQLTQGGAGGISNGGTLTLIDCALTGNTSRFDGGMSNSGTLIITKSSIMDNRGDGAAGIANYGGTVTITHSIIADHFGFHESGGLNNIAGTVVIRATTFAHNAADGGSAISNMGTLTITDSAFTDNVSYGTGPGTIANLGILEVTNTTFARNLVTGFRTNAGAGIANVGILILTNSTLADNRIEGLSASGSALASASGATTILQNTLLARNVGGGGRGPDCVGVVTSLGNNLIGNPTGCTIMLQSSDLTGDPGVAAFSDDGTPGHGHIPLLPTSPAIDAGNATACPRRDQLRQPRVNIPGVGSSRCDIGAIEFQGEAEAAGVL